MYAKLRWCTLCWWEVSTSIVNKYVINQNEFRRFMPAKLAREWNLLMPDYGFGPNQVFIFIKFSLVSDTYL
jgi:hypothetical protein